MEPHELTPLVEALLFAANQPLTVNALVKAVDDERVGAPEIKRVLDALTTNYETQPRGFKLVKLGIGVQVVTRERYAPWVKGMLAGRQKTRLSRAALETAAVVAYKQPITRIGIERIRGVDVGGVLNTLLERSLVMIKGRDPGPGRPLLYGTTQDFLDYFGLSKLGDLPRMDEIAALAKEEGEATWDEKERARFERYGVEPEAVPGPYSLEEEGQTEEAIQEGDREEFLEVVSGLADSAESAPQDLSELEDKQPLDPEEYDLEPEESEETGDTLSSGS
jgi:segregation and condensation protein B